MAARVRDLLKLVPDNILQEIGSDLEVDKPNQKLTGERIFKVLLFSLAETTRISLRTIEKVYKSVFFRQFIGEEKNLYTRHSSFADRLSKIKASYFASIFKHIIDVYNKSIPEKINDQIYRFDSTLIGLSAKLFAGGFNCGGGQHKLHFKIAVGQKGLIPASIYFCQDKTEINEDIALKNAIAEATVSKNDIIVFDRGLQSGKTYCSFTESELTFVTRIKKDRTYKIIETYYTNTTEATTGTVLSDQKIALRNGKEKRYFKIHFRLIKILGQDSKEISILTNNFTLKAEEIGEIYRRRWDIEVFFKFVKQELNLKHFLARNLNGLMVYIYMILIFSILLLIYKTKNSLTGFKFVKWDFFHELEIEIVGDIVLFCGGNSQIYEERYGFT